MKGRQKYKTMRRQMTEIQKYRDTEKRKQKADTRRHNPEIQSRKIVDIIHQTQTWTERRQTSDTDLDREKTDIRHRPGQREDRHQIQTWAERR